ncbi:hypothetical protein TrRE_jg2402 [Triparma retinervis]|uniref:Uncharacterized protein n=1 Tax=Triparma retinervis TaxID=2557542 RepID=A0A9W7DPW7_9STRA|nr:hypothetical protein TrRE_jg2402 [Triparma retinervis]
MPLYSAKAKADKSTVKVKSLLKVEVHLGDDQATSTKEEVGNILNEDGYTVLLFVQLAAWSKVADVLRRKRVNLLVVSTSSSSYSEKFKANLGFDVPGKMVNDSKRKSHKACALKSSVWASLVMPFKKHLKTFGKGAIFEALRVSLMNATRGHGSSFQQGGTFVFKKGKGAAEGDVECTLAWREQYPGDWMQIRDILKEGCGVPEGEEGLEEEISWSEVLEFVVKARKGEGGGEDVEAAKTEEERLANPTPPPAPACGDNACDLQTMRKMMKEKAEREKAAAEAGK